MSAFAIACIDGLVDGLVEMVGIGEGPVGEVVTLEVAPDEFDVVKLRGVAGQPFDREPGALAQRLGGQLARMDRAVVEDEHHGPPRSAGLRAVAAVDLVQERDEVGAALGPRGVDDQLVRGGVERTHHRHFLGLSRRLDPQIGSALSPGMRQIRMGERLRLVGEEKRDVAGARLFLAQAQP